MISSVNMDVMPQSTQVGATSSHLNESSDFSSILSLLSTISESSATMQKKEVISSSQESQISNEAEKNYSAGVGALSKKVTSLKKKIDNGDKLTSEEIESLTEELEKVISLIDEDVEIDNSDLLHLMSILSDAITTTFNGNSSFQSEDVELNSEMIVSESIPLEKKVEIENDINDIISHIGALVNKLSENKEIAIETISITNEDINSLIQQSVSPEESIENINEMVASLKEKLEVMTTEDSSIDVSKLEDQIELLEKSIQLISKASIKSESILNTTNSELSQSSLDTVNQIKIDIKEIKIETKELKIMMSSFEQSEQPQVLQSSKDLLENINRVLEGFKSLTISSSEIEKEIQVEVEKLVSIKNELTSVIAQASVRVNPNGSVVNKFVSSLELLIEKVSTYYQKNIEKTNSKESTLTIKKTEILAENISLTDNKLSTESLFSSSSITNTIKVEDIITTAQDSKQTIRVEKNESQVVVIEKIEGEELTKTMDIKVEISEKNSIPKLIEQKFSDSVRRAEIFDQVQKAMKSNFSTIHNGETKKMVINLNPKVLGSITIDVEMKDNNLSAKFRVENDVVKEIFSESTAKLKDALASIGINIVDINVDVDDKKEQTSKRTKFDHSDSGRGEQNEKERDENPRDEKRYIDSEYEIVI